MSETFEQFMENERPTLTESERASLWQSIESQLETPVLSPYMPVGFSRSVASGVLSLVVLIATTGSVLASESAKPGDLLFPVERVREEAQVLFSPNDKKNFLREQFAMERINELSEIITEERAQGHKDDQSLVETNPRVSEALLIVKEQLMTIEDEGVKQHLLQRVDAEFLYQRTDDSKTEDHDDQIKREEDTIEIRTVDQRVEVRSDGEVKIKYEDDDSKFEYREDRHDEAGGTLSSVKKFEVRVEHGRAEVRLEYGGVKQEYETTYVSDEDLVVEASARSGISIEVLLDALDIEYED